MSLDRAKKLRREPTPAEVRLWRLLYPLRTNGFHFRKQVAVGPYVADFACHHAGVIVEVDGDTHGGAAAEKHDAKRTAFLKLKGYSVLRFSNAEVMQNPEGVFHVIGDRLQGLESDRRRRTPSPSLPARGRVPGGDLG